MRKIVPVTLFTMLALPVAAQNAAPPAPAGNVLEQSSEYRFQLDLHVNDAVLAKMLPAGWVSGCRHPGRGQGRQSAPDPGGRPEYRGARTTRCWAKAPTASPILAAPVKSSDGANTGQMILGGISEDVAGARCLWRLSYRLKREGDAAAPADVDGKVTCTDDWDFAAAGGEHIQLHLKYVRGPANKGGGATKFFNPANPAQFQTSTTEQTTDITRNVTTNPPDRVLEFSLKAGGGKYAALFDGSEKPLSWDSQPTFVRAVSAN